MYLGMICHVPHMDVISHCNPLDAPAEQLCSLKRLSLVPQVPQIEIKWDVLDARDVESI